MLVEIFKIKFISFFNASNLFCLGLVRIWCLFKNIFMAHINVQFGLTIQVAIIRVVFEIFNLLYPRRWHVYFINLLFRLLSVLSFNESLNILLSHYHGVILFNVFIQCLSLLLFLLNLSSLLIIAISLYQIRLRIEFLVNCFSCVISGDEFILFDNIFLRRNKF